MSAAPQIPELELGEAVVVDWTEAEYFADRRVLTRSALRKLAQDPAGFRDEWVLGLPSESSTSKAKQFGTWSHLAVLETDEWIRRVGLPQIPRPPGAKGGTRATAQERRAYEIWRSACERRERMLSRLRDAEEPVEISNDDFERVRRVCESVWSHPEASHLLGSPGSHEQTVLWRHPEADVLLKARLDRLTWVDASESVLEGWAIPDLKTTDDPSPWAFLRSARKYWYRAQAALYTDIVHALYPDDPVQFYFIAVRSSERFETAVHTLSDDELEDGRRRYHRCLADLADRRFTEDWRHSWERGVNVLG